MLRKTILLVLLGGALLALLLVTQRNYHAAGQEQVANDLPVARVYNQYLYKRDLDHLYVEGKGPAECAEMVDRYIHKWVEKQLLIAAAETHSAYKKEDNERKVLDYRYALLVHGFIEHLVNTQLNREVSNEEIEAYYKTHRADFVLRNNIFRGKFVVLPRDVPNSAKIQSLLVGQGAALRTYCLQFASNYALDETVWLSWDKLLQDTPFSNIRNKAKLLSKGKVFQIHDEKYLYCFRIDAYRLVNDVSPLAFVRDQIADIIIYKRKIDLAARIKKDMLQQAQSNNNYVIYEH